MLTTREVKTLLAARGLRLTKRLGQHHLVDERLVHRLIEAVRLGPDDTVVEIGPGLGALTEFLLERAGRVIAVEVDRAIAELLSQRLRGRRNLTVHCGDILAFPWVLAAPAVVVGAIPYHITSPILAALCEARPYIRRAVLVVQEEVARRLAARAGTKAYGRLSILVQYGWEVSRLLPVPRGAFFPIPRVDSCAVELKRREAPAVAVADEPLFFAVVKAAFSQRRKTLVNCLTASPVLRLNRARAEAALRTTGLAPAVRGETLTIAQFAALATRLAKK